MLTIKDFSERDITTISIRHLDVTYYQLKFAWTKTTTKTDMDTNTKIIKQRNSRLAWHKLPWLDYQYESH